LAARLPGILRAIVGAMQNDAERMGGLALHVAKLDRRPCLKSSMDTSPKWEGSQASLGTENAYLFCEPRRDGATSLSRFWRTSWRTLSITKVLRWVERTASVAVSAGS
jgi:hypothetical protein